MPNTLSFWEQNSYLQYDYIVVGAGIVGLSTAASLKEREPSANVLVVERGLIPTGASTKNAGFACFGSLTEILSDLKNYGKDATMHVVELRVRGLHGLRARLGDDAIGFESTGGYELLFDEHDERLNQIDEVNALMRGLFRETVYNLRPDLIKTFGFNHEKVKMLIHNPYEGPVNSGKMMRALQHYTQSLGVMLMTGANIELIDETNTGVEIRTTNLHGYRLKARKLVVCTNAFASELLPGLEIKPGRGQVLITKPIQGGVRFRGTFHFEEGFFYFRDYEGSRIIFGGGRNLDLENETTTEFGISPLIMSALEERLQSVILPNQQYEIDQTWSGIMAFGTHRMPIIKPISSRIFAAVRMGGMGVAIGTEAGRLITEMMTKD